MRNSIARMTGVDRAVRVSDALESTRPLHPRYTPEDRPLRTLAVAGFEPAGERCRCFIADYSCSSYLLWDFDAVLPSSSLQYSSLSGLGRRGIPSSGPRRNGSPTCN